ncbi:MAG: hypothetical protein PHD02_01990 [Bacilli bacterium]|nr:hypothetical protein [Bacilli bacterium]
MKKILFLFATFFILISNVNAIDIYSSNMVLYNLSDDIIVDSVNKDDIVSIASMTKVMTALVAIENIDDIEDMAVISEDAFDGLEEENASLAGFYVGESVTYEDLLYGTLLPSGAEAATALALNISGSVYDFVTLMNNKADELGLSNTHFSNVTGIDDDNNYSTVNDVAIILETAFSNEIFKNIFMSSSYLTSDKSLTLYSTLYKSALLYDIDLPYVVGGKTGYTLNAGRCLASIAYDEVNDIYYLLVTAGAPTTTSYYHLLDAQNIYEYYFENYGYQNVVDIGDTLVSIKTKYTKEKSFDLNSLSDITIYGSNDFDKSKVTLEYDGISFISGNMSEGTKLGVVNAYYDGEIIKTFDVLLDRDIHFSIFMFILSNIHFVILLLIILYFISKLKKKKKKKVRRVR